MSEPTSKTSPFVIAASIAVIIASIVGVGAMTGLIPSRGAKTEAPPAASASAETGKAASEVATPPQPADGTADKTGKPAPEKRPAAKPKYKTAAEQPAAKTTATEESPYKAQAPMCGNCGTIASIRAVQQAGEGSGLGAIAGGVVGGLLGHQIGGGTGKDIATIAGAVGGGYAGHQVEKKVKATKHYEITVSMDDGSQRTLAQETSPPFAIGDKVKIVDGILIRN